MIRVGLTGDMGSGKSFVRDLLKNLYSVLCFDSDSEAKLVLNIDEVKNVLKTVISENIYDADGRYNIAFVKDKIKSGDEAILNTIAFHIRPYLIQRWNEFCTNSVNGVVFMESALLFESDLFEHVDFIIFVDAPLNIRVERFIKRDNMTAADYMARTKNLLSSNLKRRASDFIINNYYPYDTKAQLDVAYKEILRIELGEV